MATFPHSSAILLTALSCVQNEILYARTHVGIQCIGFCWGLVNSHLSKTSRLWKTLLTQHYIKSLYLCTVTGYARHRAGSRGRKRSVKSLFTGSNAVVCLRQTLPSLRRLPSGAPTMWLSELRTSDVVVARLHIFPHARLNIERRAL